MNVRLIATTRPQALPELSVIKRTLTPEDLIIYCARVSSPQNQPNLDTGEKLLRYCIKNKHWSIFERLCVSSGATGNLVPDAYLAALAIEHSCEWISLDHDYERFTELRWRRPLST